VAIQAVVFDIGGVLEITPSTGWEKRWEERLGLGPHELVEKLRHVWVDGDVGKISYEDVVEKTQEILGLDQAQLDEFQDDQWEEYLGTLNAELAEYFAGLRPRYKVGIISNSFVGAREREQERYGFEDMCDCIVYSHEVGIKKPDRRIYEMACERLGVQPSEMIFLDDWPQAIDAAREVGIHGVVFKDTVQAIADIQALLELDHDEKASSTSD
jgi:epoxide hydrolase-like predicted phosphatase